MSTQPNAVPQSPVDAPAVASVVLHVTRPMYWSIRREFWEYRVIYIAPLAVASLVLFGFLISALTLPYRLSISALDPEQLRAAMLTPYEVGATLILGAAFIIGIFYCLDALHGERRDRSILFWKSMPVSDLTTVMAKLTIPVVVLPLLSFAITVVTQFLMLLLHTLMLLGTGVSFGTLWTESSFIHASVMLLYHIVTVHGLWYAPFYGWLLLVSAWAPRAPFLWAVLPPFVLCYIEKLAFNTNHLRDLLWYRVMGPSAPMAHSNNLMDILAALTPMQFLSTPGLWTGLALAAAFLAVAVRLRRYRGPV